MNNYFGFYGLVDNFITPNKTKPFANNFTDKKMLLSYLIIFSQNYQISNLIFSYNNTAYPSKNELLTLLNKHSKNIKVIEKSMYKITGRRKKKKTKNFYS